MKRLVFVLVFALFCAGCASVAPVAAVLGSQAMSQANERRAREDAEKHQKEMERQREEARRKQEEKEAKRQAEWEAERAESARQKREEEERRAEQQRLRQKALDEQARQEKARWAKIRSERAAMDPPTLLSMTWEMSRGSFKKKFGKVDVYKTNHTVEFQAIKARPFDQYSTHPFAAWSEEGLVLMGMKVRCVQSCVATTSFFIEQLEGKYGEADEIVYDDYSDQQVAALWIVGGVWLFVKDEGGKVLVSYIDGDEYERVIGDQQQEVYDSL